MQTKIVTKETLNCFLSDFPSNLYSFAFEISDRVYFDSTGTTRSVSPMTIKSIRNPFVQVRIVFKKFNTWEVTLTNTRAVSTCPLVVHFNLMEEIKQELAWETAWKKAQNFLRGTEYYSCAFPTNVYSHGHTFWFRVYAAYIVVTPTSTRVEIVLDHVGRPAIINNVARWVWKAKPLIQTIEEKEIVEIFLEPIPVPDWRQAWDKVVEYRGSLDLFTHPDATPEAMYTEGTNYWFKFAPHLYVVLNGCPRTFVAIPNDVHLDDMRPTYDPTGEPAWRPKSDIGYKSLSIRRVKL